MNEEVKNNEVAVNMNQNNTNEVPAQTTTNNEVKENTMNAEQNSTTEQGTVSTQAQAPVKAKRSNHKKTEAERIAEKIRAKEERAKELAAMTDDEKKAELERLEHRIKQINNGARHVGVLYKQIRDEKLYEQSEYSSSFTLYCRVTFKESRSNVYRQINYIEILDIIGETTRNIAEKTIRPLTCFKITSTSKNTEEDDKDKNKEKDAPEQYDTVAILAVWKSVKAARKTVTEKLVKEHIMKYRKTLLGGDDPDKVYVPSMNKCFDRSSFVDELIKEKKTAAGLLSVTKEMKDILTVEDLMKIKEESDSLTDKEFETYQKEAHAGSTYNMFPTQKSA